MLACTFQVQYVVHINLYLDNATFGELQKVRYFWTLGQSYKPRVRFKRVRITQ